MSTFVAFTQHELVFLISDPAILREIGRSLRQIRLNRNQPQQVVADASGIDRATLSLIEHSRPTSLLTFVQLLRALEQLDLLNNFLVQAEINPVALARLTAKQRKQASAASDTSSSTSPPSEW